MEYVLRETIDETRLPDLEEACGCCSGKGAYRFKGEVLHYNECDGKGTIPTAFGQRVLKFLATFSVQASG